MDGGVNPASAELDHCGNITADETWFATDNVHVVSCDVAVVTGVTLTIAEGAIVKFKLGTTLYVDGALRVEGTIANSVYLTSFRDDTIGGDTNGDGGATTPAWDNWRGIEYRAGSDDGTSLIDHAVIRYGGHDYRGNITLIGASPTIQNSALTDGYHAIRADLESFPVLSNNTYSDNGINGFSYYGGTIDQDSTWDITDTSYFIDSDVYVAAGKTLTIEPGTIVKFNVTFNGVRLVIDGALRVEGADSDPVYLTSLYDDTVGGDTNNDGGATTPNMGNWNGIAFNAGSDDATSLIDRAVIRFTGNGPGGNINLTAASPTIQNTSLTNGYHAIRGDLESFPVLTNNTYKDNSINGFSYYGGTIDQDTTWDMTDTSYLIFDDVYVAPGSMLTIKPGVVTKFDEHPRHAELVVGGSLRVEGTSSNPVYMTSIHDDAIGGDTNGNGAATYPGWSDWRGVTFAPSSDDSTSLVDHAVISYGTDGTTGNITLNGASPTIQNSTLTQGYHAIRADLESFPTLINNTYHDNNINGLTYNGGTIDQNTVWDMTDTSYFIMNDLFVGTGITLTIKPGVVVKFNAGGQNMVVDGALRVEGATSSPVHLTSIQDDSVGGDTNNDGGATTPQWHDWGGVEFRSGSNGSASLIDHAIIRFAGDRSSGSLTFIGVSPTVQYSTLADGHIGIETNGAQPILVCNNIHSNGAYGILNATPSVVVNAAEQWWGSTTGPYHDTLNPAGTGNEVSDGVLFSPWLNAPCGTPNPLQPVVFLATIFN